MRNKYGFTFGADPELFLFDKDGAPQPAVGIIPGTKEEPLPVPGGAIQRDGLAAEFNIDPTDNFDDFIGNCNKVQESLRSYLPEGWSLRAVPAVEFSKEVIDAMPADALELGCDPDFDAWTGEVNLPPELNPKKPGLRTASGHIHIGWGEYDIEDEAHRKNCFDLVKQLDWYVGAWLARLERGSAGAGASYTRRSLYGRAGACRVKPYGVEYRVPSNYWLVAPTNIQQQLWLRIQQAIEGMRSSYLPERFSGGNKDLIKYINSRQNNSVFEDNFYTPVLELAY